MDESQHRHRTWHQRNSHAKSNYSLADRQNPMYSNSNGWLYRHGERDQQCHRGESGPTVVSVTITSNQAREFNTSTLTCSGVANDPDGGTPTFSFVWSHNGTDVGTGNTLALDTTNYAPTDSITCTATASDVHGGSDSDTETVTVKNKCAPTVTRVTLSKTAGVLTGDTLSCSATATDADGETPTLSYVWRRARGGSVGDVSTGDTVTLNTATWQPGDTVICKAKATDAYSGSNTSNASVSIGNRLPNITDVAITPNTNVTTTTKLTCVGTGSDPDNSGALTWSYTWRNQTTATILGTGSAFTLTTSDASPFDVIQCKATAVDADSGTADQVATVSVVNSNPVFSSHTISPNSDISTSDELTCAASATDPDNTTVTTSFTWTNKTTSTNMGTGRTLQLTTTNSSPNDEIECTAVATDADGGSTSSTVSVLVGNATPTVDTLSISPSTAVKTNTRLTCTATASDDDGGTPSIVYAWKNVTSSTALGTTSTLLLTNTTASPDDEIECSVTASDIHGGSATSSVRVTVENSAPVITDVTVTPDTGVTTDSVLSCSATATDIDGGTPSFTYEWIKNSTTSLGSGAGLTLDPANVSPGDNVACKAQRQMRIQAQTAPHGL